MSKHTPKPWKAEFVGSSGSGDNIDDVYEVHAAGGHFRVAEYMTPADARLIAAAPDLLEACKDALESLEMLQGGCTDFNDGTVEALTVWCPEVIDSLSAAIAKAEGKS